jgi:hypothetical protein
LWSVEKKRKKTCIVLKIVVILQSIIHEPGKWNRIYLLNDTPQSPLGLRKNHAWFIASFWVEWLLL